MKYPVVLILLFLTSILTAAESKGLLVSGQEDSDYLRIDFSLQDSALTRTRDTTDWMNAVFATAGMEGRLGSIWTFESEVRVHTDFVSAPVTVHDYQPWRGLPYNKQSKRRRTWDVVRARSDVDLSPVTLSTGLDYLRMGPNSRTRLAWAGYSNRYRAHSWNPARIEENAPLFFAGFEAELGRFRYLHYNGLLKHDRLLKKFFNTHRLEIKFPARTTIGVGETVIYGTRVEPIDSRMPADSVERDFEAIYALPFLPYLFAEHYGGDRDNVNLSIDATSRAFNSWELRFELLLDDLKSPEKMFDNSWWGNKWGAVLALTRFDTLGLWTVDSDLEYARIEPWVYTHTSGASHQYSNFGRNLGSDLGPNSEEISLQLKTSHPQYGSPWLELSSVRKDSAKGSSISDIHFLEDPIDKKFLNPASTLHYWSWGGGYSIFFRKHIQLKAGLLFSSGDIEETMYFSRVGISL